uniref:Probable arginine--tRNA ligase, cytoplasmic n=1 Tax=Cacopsylla melanoneura TaxID=428564 RepID=A0A8D8VM71_9HEMI
MEKFEKYNYQSEESEAKLKEFINKVNELSSQGFISESASAEVVAAQLHNTKLKHRLSILQRAIAEEEKKLGLTSTTGSASGKAAKVGGGGVPKKMSATPRDRMSIRDYLTDVFTHALQTAFPDLEDKTAAVTPTNEKYVAKFGDYQCNDAMALCKIYKDKGVKKSPLEIAQSLANVVTSELASNPGLAKVVDKIEVAKPGFVNVFLSRVYAGEQLKDIVLNGVQPPGLDKRLRVVVDFSSPNIAKEMHVGHLRSTILGDAICRLLEYLGHDVVRLNHVGDWGTQFGMLIAHLQDTYPDYLTKSPPIADLQAFYKQSKKRFDEDEVFKKRAYQCVVSLQRFEPDYKKAWDMICDVSRRDFQKIYDRLNVTLTERGESFYQKYMEELVPYLEKKGLLEPDDGRKIMWGDDRGSIPMTIVKSDGGFTYDTSDMAALKHRVEHEKADWIVYVTDLGQGVHFKLLAECSKKAGVLNANKTRMDFVGFGVVLGEDKKKFKTRSGDTVKLTDLLDEGLRRSLDKLKEKNRHTELTPSELSAAQQAVAYGCIKYADLSHNRQLDYVFSFDKMLDDRGNTAAYLLYAYTRIASIARAAGVRIDDLVKAAHTTPVSLDHPKEFALAKTLLRMNDVLSLVTRDLCLHHLCEYLYDVSTAFSEFYDNCYCIEKDEAGTIKQVHTGRLLLAEATARVMKKCFDILNINTVHKM